MLKPPLPELSGAMRASVKLPSELATPLLAHLSPAQFMRRYWQKKPLLIRQAIAGIKPPLSRDALFELASNDDVESRLITHFRQHWRLTSGPFAADMLPSLRQRAWTLLVQGVDLHDDRARALLECFRFIPDARLDDLMISYATDGGGVGPHFDSYDVFLLQVQGKRRWHISTQQNLSLQTDLPLKILAHFEPSDEWVLEPGDMLYLPPHIAHDGIAEGECMTCSIGFRAPCAKELSTQFLYHLAERGGLTTNVQQDTPYRDPTQAAVDTPACLPPQMIKQVTAMLSRIQWNERDIATFLGCYLSEPKPNVVFDRPPRSLSFAAFKTQATRRGARLDKKTTFLYDTRTYFINGENHPLPPASRWLAEIADTRRLSAKRFATLCRYSSVTAVLYEWYRAGWLQIGEHR